MKHQAQIEVDLKKIVGNPDLSIAEKNTMMYEAMLSQALSHYRKETVIVKKFEDVEFMTFNEPDTKETIGHAFLFKSILNENDVTASFHPDLMSAIRLIIQMFTEVAKENADLVMDDSMSDEAKFLLGVQQTKAMFNSELQRIMQLVFEVE